MSKHRITAHPIVDLPFDRPEMGLVPIIILPNGKFLYEAWRFITSPARRGLAYSTKRKQVEAIALLADYYHFRYRGRPLNAQDSDSLMSDFTSSYLNGTIDDNGQCPYSLYWQVRSSTWAAANSVLQYLTAFLEFCSKEFGFAQLNPLEETDQTRFRALCQDNFLKTHSMFNYLKDRRSNSISILNHRKVQIPKNVLKTRTLRLAKAFPNELIKPFFTCGLQHSFKKKSSHIRSVSIRDQLYFMLLLFQGVRKSEPLHLFVDDIRPIRDGGNLKTQIRYYHPVIGRITHPSRQSSKILSTTRSEFLQSQYGRLPRNRMNGIEYAGWKGISLEHGSPDYFAEGYWIIEEYSQVFLKLHAIYINEIRPQTVNHPYYFVCLDRSSYGRPLTVSAVNEIFERACARIGAIPNREEGINIHGFRHRYGQMAVNLGLPPQVIQRMLHHSSIHSQTVYASPSPSLVNEILKTTSPSAPMASESQVNSDASLKAILDAWNIRE